MPKLKNIKKVLVIGSGPIIIGQAAEFDYSGTQACKALRGEGIEVVLINSNPATIMTDLDIADKIYIEPLTIDIVSRIIDMEKPDGILASLGGQTGLNLAMQLADTGLLEKLNIKLLGTSLSSIKMAEDRQLFKKVMEDIGEKVAQSSIASSYQEAMEFASQIGFPIIIRPAFTLGGTGGGIAHNMDEFKDIVSRGLINSIIHQVLLEESVAGWKEIEYEVIRDNEDNCMVICNMENLDPVGIHTGDSIVVVPTQTLSPYQEQMLEQASIKIIRALDIKGGCNIQFALHPTENDYVVIEVNPRVSRSSALASKATGFPIAKVTSKIAIGFNLKELSSYRPVSNYVVTKVPRWPFDKFSSANRTLDTQMKATGEVMAIGSNLEESLLKAIDSLDIGLNYHIGMKKISLWDDSTLERSLKNPDDERIFAVSEALRRGYSIDQIHDITKIDKYFISKLKNITDLSQRLESLPPKNLSEEILLKCKQYGFGNSYIANLMNTEEKVIEGLCNKYGIKPSYQVINAWTENSQSAASYFYSCYDHKEDAIPPSSKPKVVVLGSGPIRIGQGIEFDYCSVHSVKTLREMGFEAIIINSNPETVSTDFDTADVLYFEPLTYECVMDVLRREKPLGVIVQFGGQTSINLAYPLSQSGVNVLGTSVENLDRAEDRDKFLQALTQLAIPLPPGKTAYSLEEAARIAEEIGYPVLVRPSYVLGGRAMEIIYSNEELASYMEKAIQASGQHPVLVDKYILGKEVEVDGISDGKDVVVAGIMEHIERAGVHSGDSFSVYPPQGLSKAIKDKVLDYSIRIARELKIKGLFNIQFVIDENFNLYVLEVNPRASRTVPILSKITGIPMVGLATRVMMGQSLKAMGFSTGLVPESSLVTVKGPVFSFSKLTAVDTFLGPEMKSTGEVMGTDISYTKAMQKAMMAAEMILPQRGKILFSLAHRDKERALPIARSLQERGYQILATNDTWKYFDSQGLTVQRIEKANALKLLKEKQIQGIINTPTLGKVSTRLGFLLRRKAMEYKIPCITSLDTAQAMLKVVNDDSPVNIFPLDQYSSNYVQIKEQ
ncbi:MAG: carbamoyl-phosphate synthase large subunit [Clostridiales bacterium]|nr:carbamoyl-phosphate synthase large subunit [Clostridiales bacterium]